MLFICGMVDIISFSELQKSRLMLYKTNNECLIRAMVHLKLLHISIQNAVEYLS